MNRPETQSIDTRDELIQALAVASELEQGLCLQYLFTAFSLKDDVSEGLSPRELTFVRKWKANIFLIGAQEMLHLAQAGNLCTAIGGGLHLRRPNYPQRPDYYPTRLPWGLFPFSRDTISVYALYERPTPELSDELRRLVEPSATGLSLEASLFREDPTAFRAKRPHDALPGRYDALRPKTTSAVTIGELYTAIRNAFEALTPPSGELFIGDPELQMDGRRIDFQDVTEIRSRPDAARAIDLIIRQGEGAPQDRIDSHFGVFVNILREYDALRRENPTFSPARDVHPNPLSRLHVDNNYPGFRLIHDDYTRAVNDLNSGVYDAMVTLLYRLFATPRRAARAQKLLASAALRVMTTVVKPLGEALTRLPMGDDGTRGAGNRPRFCGPSFEVDRSVELVPDARAGWISAYEQLVELSARARVLAESPEASAEAHRAAIPFLRAASTTLSAIAASLGPELPPRER
jgi:hypothetical protein